jgi:hypothetical protein
MRVILLSNTNQGIIGPVVVSAIVAGVLMVGGFFMLGIPGALYAGLAEIVVAPMLGQPIGSLTDGDRALGIALLMTLIVPPILPVAQLGLMLANRSAHWSIQVLVALAALYIWSCAIVLYITLNPL